MQGNWQAYDASTPESLRKLDREVATRLGWRFERRPYMSDDSLLIFDPEGREAYHQTGTWTSVFSEHNINDVVPRYSTDANAALRLIEGEFEGNPDFDLMPTKCRKWSVVCKVGGGVLNTVAETPSLAVVKAWLSYQDMTGIVKNLRAVDRL